MKENEGIQKIIARILEDANAEAAVIREKAGAEAAEILRKAEAEAAAKKEETEQLASREGALRMSLTAGASEMERKRQRLAAKQEMVAQCYEQAAVKLKSDPKRYTSLLLSFIEKACRSVGEQEKTDAARGTCVFLSDEDFASYGKQIREKCRERGIAVSDVCGGGDASGGVLVKNGDICRNYSMDAVITQLRRMTEEEVTTLLFAE